MVDPEIMKWLEEWINNPEQVDRLTHWQTSDLCKLLTDFAASREQAIAELREALDEAQYILWFDDPDHGAEIITGCEAAHKRYEWAKLNWNCRLFVAEHVVAALSQARPDSTESSSRQAIADQAAVDMREQAAEVVHDHAHRNGYLNRRNTCELEDAIRSLPVKPVPAAQAKRGESSGEREK